MKRGEIDMLPMIAEVTTANAAFSTEQISAISTALTSAVNNTLSMFINLLPAMALICGVAFGIRFVRGLFKQVKDGK